MKIQLTLLCYLLLVFLPEFCISKDVAPGVSEHMYCEGCIATIQELIKLTDKKSSDPRDLVITEALENICKPYNFVKYDYSPPKTVKACQLLIERHEEDLESALAKRTENLEKKICYDVSGACTNVDRSQKPKDLGGMDLSMDGKPGKVEKVLEMDPATGQPKEKKETAGEPKTLSKKDKKSKKAKKEKKSKQDKKVNKKEDKKKTASPDMMHVDINDPDSINKVLAQIQQVAKDHSNEFYKKQEEDETKREEEDEMKNKDKDEL